MSVAYISITNEALLMLLRRYDQGIPEDAEAVVALVDDLSSTVRLRLFHPTFPGGEGYFTVNRMTVNRARIKEIEDYNDEVVK